MKKPKDYYCDRMATNEHVEDVLGHTARNEWGAALPWYKKWSKDEDDAKDKFRKKYEIFEDIL